VDGVAMNEDKNNKNVVNPVEAMLVLAKEAEAVIGGASASAMQKAEEETEKMLQQYEQRARQIMLKIREETRVRAEEMAARFRDAMILGAEQASTVAIDEATRSMGAKVDDIVRRLQESVRKDTQAVIYEKIVPAEIQKTRTAPEAKKVETAVSAKAEQPATVTTAPAAEEGKQAIPEPEDFAAWLMQ
jgi:hypothetical protein